MPPDRFTLTVGVGRDVDVRGILRGLLELLDDLLARGDGFVLLGEAVLDVDAKFALGRSRMCPIDATTL
jgi:hypothetical protein